MSYCDCSTRCFGVRPLTLGCQNLPAASETDAYRRPLTPRQQKLADQTDAELRRVMAGVRLFK